MHDLAEPVIQTDALEPTLYDVMDQIIALHDRADATDDRIDNLRDHMDERFTAVDQRFEAIDRRFDTLEHQFQDMSQVMGTLLRQFGEMQITLKGIVGLLTERMSPSGS